MVEVKTPEKGSFGAGSVGGCPGVCGGCPRACSSRPQIIRGESGSEEVLVFSSVKELLQLQKLPIGRIYFSSDTARPESGHAPIRTSEKVCSECNKPASACSHSETSKN